MATLSIVRSITNSWRRRFGINRTNFRIRNKRNVRNTLNPELPSLMPKNCCPSSKTLQHERKLMSVYSIETSRIHWTGHGRERKWSALLTHKWNVINK